MRKTQGLFASLLLVGYSGCFLFSGEEDLSGDPISCGSDCAATPEATADADDKPWGIYKSVGNGLVSLRMNVGGTDPLSTSTCEAFAGNLSMHCSMIEYKRGDNVADRYWLRFEYGPKDSGAGCCSGIASFWVGEDGKVEDPYYTTRKELSSSLVRVFAGRTGRESTNDECGAILQDGVLTACCDVSDLTYNEWTCFQAPVQVGKAEGQSCKKPTSTAEEPTCGIPTSGSVTTFSATLSADDTSLSGTWMNDEGAGTFEMVRTL